jgi:hypothetical protein
MIYYGVLNGGGISDSLVELSQVPDNNFFYAFRYYFKIFEIHL